MGASWDELSESVLPRSTVRTGWRRRAIPWLVAAVMVVAIAVCALLLRSWWFSSPELPETYADSYPAPYRSIELHADGSAILSHMPQVPVDGECAVRSLPIDAAATIEGTWRKTGSADIEVTTDAGATYVAHPNYRAGGVRPEWDRINLEACAADGSVTSIPLWSSRDA